MTDNPAEEPVAFYEPRALAERPPDRALALAIKAAEGRLAFYVGAGLSMSPPTCLPRGSEVQERVAERARRLLGVEVPEPAGERPTLEELGDAATALGGSEKLDRLREQAAAAVDFVHAPPNFGHQALALLLREGLVQVLTVNWDCGVERAGSDLGYEVARVMRQQDRTYGPTGPVIDKLNGCASRPATLRMTRAEVDVPQQWAEHRVGSLLTDGIVVFLGLGTVGGYVADGVDRMLIASQGAPLSVLVVDPWLSQEWSDALGDHAQQAHVQQTANRFLDDLLRAVLRQGMTEAVERAKRWAQDEHPCAEELSDGSDELFAGLEQRAAVPVWRWWRDGAAGQSQGRSFILDNAGVIALATACALVADGPLSISGDEDALAVETPKCYVEICSWPGVSASTVLVRQADRIRRRRRRGVYRDLAKRVVSISVGHDGLLPRSSAVLDIAEGAAEATDIVEGPERLSLGWVAADSFAQGGTLQIE